jgi:3-oxoadipate enol-lactonase
MPFADGNGFRTYFEVHGSGDPVLCPGGWAIITGMGHERLPERLRKEFTTIVYDHRGLGQSTDSADVVTTAEYGQDAARVIEAAGFDKVHVFGHGGLGACLSQHLAAQSPHLVDRLVLVSGWAGPDPYKRAQGRIGQLLFDLRGFPAYQQWGALLVHTPEYYNEHEAELLSKNGSWGEFSEEMGALRKVQAATVIHDARAVLPTIEAPTLAIHGELDIVDPPRLGRELVSLIPNARLEVIAGAPHLMRSMPEAYTYFGDLVGDFLNGH